MKTLGEVIRQIEALQSAWEDEGFSHGDDLDEHVEALKALVSSADAAGRALAAMATEIETANSGPHGYGASWTRVEKSALLSWADRLRNVRVSCMKGAVT